MLLKPLTAYLLGCLTVAISISAALGAPGRLGSVFGVLGTFLAIGLFLRSPKRAGWVAKLLLRIAGPSEVVLKVQKSQNVKITPPPLPKEARIQKPRIRSTDNPVFVDVVLALRGMGSNQETARWAAGQATMRLPEGDFNEIFKLAVQCATGRA